MLSHKPKLLWSTKVGKGMLSLRMRQVAHQTGAYHSFGRNKEYLYFPLDG